MDGESRALLSDCFLRPVANAKSTNTPAEVPPPKSAVKVELQVLRLSDDSQKYVMNTLRSIHGEDFKLKDRSKYKDKGGNLKKGYWEDRGTLLVQGVTNYSNIANSGCEITDRFHLLAIVKLESYGFPKEHCIEALQYCNKNGDDALELLYSKYFPCETKSSSVEVTADEVKQLREDEKGALLSIYDPGTFQETEPNKVWLLKFRVDHLLAYSPSEQKKARKKEEYEKNASRNANKPKKQVCRHFLTGSCKFGSRCRYSHESEDKSAPHATTVDPNCDPNWFFVEFKFPAESKYPYQPPHVYLKTTCPDIPTSVCLRLTRRLNDEARKLAEDGMPSVYTICESLNVENEIKEFLKNDRYEFPNAKYSIFHEVNSTNNSCREIKDLPTHYTKNNDGRNNENNRDMYQLIKDNKYIIRRFLDRQSTTTYKKMMQCRERLPAWNMKSDILKIIQNNQVVIISGETGCGKSTQVPQYLLDDWMESGLKNSDHIEIVCTQPRRLSAIGVAERVADERVEKVGNTIGYQIRLENKISQLTRLTFCTTGILLRRLQSDPILSHVTHIIIDEVHERSEESDFLLLILKDLLLQRKDLKVILMSATLNTDILINYFNSAPILTIPGKTFPVEQLFLEDILDLSRFVLEADSPFCKQLKRGEADQLLQELEYADIKASNAAPPKKAKDETLSIAEMYARYSDFSKATCKTLFLMDPLKVNPELIESILLYIVNGEHNWPQEGSILIFLPGFAEIKTVYDSLNDHPEFSSRSGKYLLVPLHSSLTNEEQALVFKRAPNGKRKIVLSTNIAETSVTIDDCVYVIDCGQMKEKHFDPNKNMESLDLVWVSRANALQRKGRAGRVMPGIAIHLFTRHRFSNQLISQPIPEIQRIPLEQVLMRIRTLPSFQATPLPAVMGKLLEPPTDESITSSIKRLQDVGAFDVEENLTALGHHLAALPVDVRIGKLMLFGAIFQCLDSVLTIAACLSYKSPFQTPFGKKNEATTRKKQFAICNSDQLTCLNAYKKWLVETKKSRRSGKCFADQNFMSVKTLEMIMEIKYQFLDLLDSIGFIPVDLKGMRKRNAQDLIADITGVEMNVNGENYRLLSALLCGALYPNLVKILTPERSYVKSMGGAVPKLHDAKDLRFKTRDDGYVAIHPGSVNASAGSFLSPFLIYQEKVKTSRIYLRECTMVAPLPLVLFTGSDINLELRSGEFIILIEDGWIKLQASSHEVAEMLKCLRLELINLMEEKIRDPYLNLLNHQTGKKIISTIIYLISKE